MRILYLHQFFRLPEDGGGVRSYELARRWVEAGHHVTMVTSDMWGDRDDVSITEEAGIDVHWLPIPYRQEMGFLRRLGSFGTFVRSATAYTRRLPPHDVVLATSAPLTIAIPAIAAKRRWNVPMVFEVRDLWPGVPLALGALPRLLAGPARLLERLAYRASAHIVSLSPGMSAGVVAVDGDADRVSVIPNSSDLETFDIDPAVGQQWKAARSWDDGRPLLVYTGTFGVVNEASWLVELVREMRANGDDPRLLMVGFGSEEDAIRLRAKALGLLDSTVHIQGYVSKAEIAAILSASDISFSTVADVPALADNSANKIFDAFASRTPIAINHGGWLADLLERSGAGLVLHHDDVEKSARLVGEFLADPRATTAAADACHELAATTFNRDRHAESYRLLLESVSLDGSAAAVRFA